MPRQPFLPTFSYVKHYAVGPTCLEQRPALAAIIGQCMGMWANAELHVALSLGALLGVESDAAVAVFLSLRNARAQREAISAAAAIILSADEFDVFDATMAVYSAVGRHRHDLAHGIYGIADELPDAVLWTETSKHAHFCIEVYNKETKPGGLGPDPHARMKDDLYVYREKDLLEAYKLITSAWEA